MQLCFLLFALFGANGFLAAKQLGSPSEEGNVAKDSKIYVTEDAVVFLKDSIFSSQIVQSAHKNLGQVYVHKGASVFGKSSLYADAVIDHQDKEKKKPLVAKAKTVKLRKKKIQKMPSQDSAKDNVFVRASGNERSFFALQKASCSIATGFSSYSNGFLNHLQLFSLDKRKFFNLSIKSIISINATNFKKLGLKISRPPPFFSFVNCFYPTRLSNP